MRTFVVVGQRATASPEFSLLDVPSSAGRLDILLRCLRAALLVSHGLRTDTRVYLVLLGGPSAPRTIRVEGARAAFVRPDERSLAVLVQKTLAVAPQGARFVELRRGIAIANIGLDGVLAELAKLGPTRPYVLERDAPDVRDVALDLAHPVFFLGDHLGLDDASRARLREIGAEAVSIGPLDVHADDAVAVASNELDRRIARVARREAGS